MKNPGVSGWRGPYLHELPKDPWGHPYIYHRSGSDFKILSAGPDGQEGTADDIGG
jgi:general secretion pathway protein G